ncbi:TonB-dependent siderophore receptor, partial [Steroidobacter sp.]|uniref:TonB-dependent siderophore receptor n=1 Tax=Steroidobacter sp. TaxID=1978227 RepID=UPI001A448868
MKRSLDTTSALAICAALSGSAAQAQSNDAETIDTIIVTESRIQQHVTKMGSASLETPQNIQVLSQGFLKDMGVSLLDDALRNVAGVSASSFVYAYDLPSIRGFPAGGFTLLDGLPRTVALNIEPQALERVEVIKGPTSALYGQGAPGGVINLVSKRPVKKSFADASFTVGSYDMMIPALDIGGSLDADQSVYGRLNALYRQEGTYVDYTDGVKRLFLGPSLTWEIGADTEITFIGHYSQERNELIPDRPATGLLLPNPNGRLSPRQTIEDPDSPPQIDQRYTSIGYEFEHRFSERLKVVQNVRQSWTELDYFNIYQPLFLDADQRTLYLYGNDLDESRRSLGIDTLLIGSFDMGSVRHRLAAGFEYGRQRVDSKPSYAFSPLVAFDLFAPDYSVFQRGDFALFPSLREDES